MAEDAKHLHLTPTELAALGRAVGQLMESAMGDDRYRLVADRAERALDKVIRANNPRARRS